MNQKSLPVRSKIACLILPLFVLTTRVWQSPPPPSDKELSDELFKNPTREFGIRCWWWWLNGNVTKEAITRDLEEMKAKGFSGACIFDAGGQNQRGNGDVPEGPLWGSPAWRALYIHAINEADRLGLVMSLSIQSGWNLGGPDITPAEAAKQVVYSETSVKGGLKITEKLTLPKIHDDFYEDITVLAIPSGHFTNTPIRDFADKTASKEAGGSAPDTRPLLFDVPPSEDEEDGKLEEVINLTGKFKNGLLQWEAPAGEWTILRMGYTTTKAEVSTASGKWQGRVLDYLSEKHFNRYWNTHVEPLLTAIGNKAGKTLRYLQTDSFEAGGMNWTEGFEKEFRQRRGYDPIPYLPILAGKLIGNRDISNRFLSDFRKTISDCVSDKHYRLFSERAAKFGMGIQPESAGPHAGPFDGLKNYGHSEIMMSEFWSPSLQHRVKPVDRYFVKQAASAAKIYNKKLVGAESFTTIGPHWNDIIWANMKPAADHEFCAGLNLIYLHTFTCSPKEMGLPGQEYFAGTHFNPNVTWWNYSTGFIKYLSRIHYMMQEGISQADVLCYYGDHVPNIGRYKEDDPGGALPGYDYDLINEDRLLALTYENGKITLPHGASYKILSLPDHQVLSLAALRKISELVENGAIIVGKKTLTTASLVKYPEAEKIREEIAGKLWGEGISEKGQKKVGKGIVCWGETAKEVLPATGTQPDLAISKSSSESSFDFIHRKWNTSDYFFISNQTPKEQKGEFSFRISGKLPELWNAVTGEIRSAAAFRQENGRTIIPLEFDPFGSWFIVFRKAIPVKENGKKADNFTDFQKVLTLDGAWDVKFDPKWGGPSMVRFEKLESWIQRPEEGIKYYSGTAVYSKNFDLNKTDPKKSLFLDLGQVLDVGVAKVKLNGKDLGIVWTPPFRVSASGVLKAKNNVLEIEVTNSWRNRLTGDRGKPESERFTKTNIKILPEWKLLDSGLIGPVELLQSRERNGASEK